MFTNYLKVALRSLWKSKGFSAINIIGLAVGLATCLLIMMYVYDELSFDRFHKKADRIYRVDAELKINVSEFDMAVMPDPVAATLMREFPQVEQATRFRMYGGFRVKKGNQNIQEDQVIYADPNVFDVFTFPMIEGDPATALKDPYTVVITETTAKKYFNRTNVVGESFVVNDDKNYKITGVIKDIPDQSHLRYDFFVSLTESEEAKRNVWLSHNFPTYLTLKPGTDVAAFEKALQSLIERYASRELKKMMNSDIHEFCRAGNYYRYVLTPLTNIHLYSNRQFELDNNSSIEYVYIFSAVAVFILLIACVNFMNLSTARSSNRAREVGVRKVLGSMRKNLIAQFLTESTLVTFIGLLLAMVIAWALLPWFNQLSGKTLSMGTLNDPLILLTLAGIVVTVGFIAGSYPAFYLSSFQPIQVLKGKLSAGFKTGWLRNSLVVFQFGISIFLIIGTLVIYDQLKYIREKNLGYDREHVLVLQNGYSLGTSLKPFKESLLQMEAVQGITTTGYLPTADFRTDNSYFKSPTMDQRTGISLQSWPVDDEYIPVMNMKMAAGRNFSKEFPTDSQAIILNESAVRLLGLKDPINTKLYTFIEAGTNKSRGYTIIGVVKDFNFNSLREQVTPMGLLLEQQSSSMAIRVKANTNIKTMIAQVENKWKAIAPGQPFRYSFMDDDFDATYKTEQRTGKISLTFAALAILIACMGLFGLAAYSAEQRTKEIGIRKVLGADVSTIMAMLSKDFLKLVSIAAVIAFPLAWWAMSGWLESFAYRVSIGWWVFAVTGIAALLIAVLTVSFQALRAALANPVKSLRAQ